MLYIVITRICIFVSLLVRCSILLPETSGSSVTSPLPRLYSLLQMCTLPIQELVCPELCIHPTRLVFDTGTIRPIFCEVMHELVDSQLSENKSVRRKSRRRENLHHRVRPKPLAHNLALE